MKETENKVLLKSYVTYAKGSGGELRDYVVLDKNDIETLKSYYDDIVGDDVWGDFDSFLKGETITWATYGDWDEPTGGEMFLVTYEQELDSISNGFSRQIKELNKAFGVKIEDYLTTTTMSICKLH